ncbi:MAG: energy-coupling factor transporter transmembrane component T [Catonella sp.]|uniref:energy-coupling factor transporter transmembrane component T n=1 Tax=Catonella sp. TaxID=2382125 RepID=UPI003F9F51D9
MKIKAIKINPSLVLFFNLLIPTLFMFMAAYPLNYILMVFASLVLVIGGKLKRTLILIFIYGLLWGGNVLFSTVFSIGSLAIFCVLMMQFMPCVMMATILFRDYTTAELLSALERLPLPRNLVVAVIITLRYVPTFKREFGYIKESMRLRGIAFTWKKPIESFRYFIVPQLFRCTVLAEEVTSAGLVKGIDANIRRSSYYEQRFKKSDGLLVILLIIGIVWAGLWKI